AKGYLEWMKLKLIDTYNDIMHDALFQEEIKLKGRKDEASLKEYWRINKKRKKYFPENYPSFLKIGDIVHVNFGKSYCTELSDGHYAVILSDRIGSHYLVAPLSSTRPKGRILYFNDLGLPSKDQSNDSYIKFDHIKFVSYRRLKNIEGIQGGVKHINTQKGQNRVKEILNIFNEIIKNT
ncbi:MAG: type II toxin-antitoxin system PemK/MazF family toxin, partial [Actinobacteria bacterium]|nr:type II toxin-antitoxin system PemK/MazF family toxin [Actinomycetota bacterium]